MNGKMKLQKYKDLQDASRNHGAGVSGAMGVLSACANARHWGYALPDAMNSIYTLYL